jgi:hypothetical protein
MDAIEDHFEQVEESIHEETRSTGNLYMGRRIDRYHERTRSIHHNRVFSPDFTLGSFKTEEISTSPVTLAAILRRAIDSHAAIDFIGNTEVLAADRLATGDVEVEFLLDGKTSKKRYPSVANCLWDDKLRVDRTAGIRDRGPWILRYKATVNFSAPSAVHGDIPSATGILGSYGDVVNHNNGSYYVSWYPLTKIAQSVDGDGRRLHDMVHKGIVSRWIRTLAPRGSSISRFVASIAHEKFIDDNIREMAAFIPSMATLVNRKRHCEIGGGVILARGATDIDDPTSDLHRRDEIGPVAHGSYVTIDTGKYCMAPLFALQAADMITDALN